jgi:hypothetical protein
MQTTHHANQSTIKGDQSYMPLHEDDANDGSTHLPHVQSWHNASSYAYEQQRHAARASDQAKPAIVRQKHTKFGRRRHCRFVPQKGTWTRAFLLPKTTIAASYNSNTCLLIYLRSAIPAGNGAAPKRKEGHHNLLKPRQQCYSIQAITMASYRNLGARNTNSQGSPRDLKYYKVNHRYNSTPWLCQGPLIYQGDM